MAIAVRLAETRLAQTIQEGCGENVNLCYQCKKCTSGCPVAEEMDLTPTQVMRAVQLGLVDMALASRTIWLCACCETCTARCPQAIDVAKVMDHLKALAVERGVRPAVPSVASFNRVAMRTIKSFGRMYELGLMGELNLRTGQPFKDLDLGIKMLKMGKLKLLPTVVRYPSPARRKRDAEPIGMRVDANWPVGEAGAAGPLEHEAEKRPVAGAKTRVAYYPGCSLHSVAAEYDLSTRAVAEVLGLELAEPEGWVCCGSTPAHATSHYQATLLPLKSLALVERQGDDYLTLPCASCFSRFRTAMHEVERDPELKREVTREIGVPLAGRVEVRHLVDTLTDKVGVERIAAAVARPLAGLKVACYYGCLLTRPPAVTGAEHPENPRGMDRIMAALGAEALEWPSKTDCCGASLSLTETKVALKLSERILAGAADAGAEAIVTACPLCQPNLDSRQDQIRRVLGKGYDLPIFYFTQLMGLAFGLDTGKLGTNRHFVDPVPLLKNKGLVA